MMSLVVVLKATLILALGSAALLLARSASATVRHRVCVFTLAVSVLAFCTGGLPWGIESGTLTLTVDAAQSLKIGSGPSIDMLSFIWIAGVLALVLRFLAGTFYLARQTRRSSLPPLNLTRETVRVRISDVCTPIVWGWFRPTVLMPRSSSNWTQTERDLAIAHEMAHIRRRDLWLSLISLAARSLYWFHPLAWWVSDRMREEQEKVCDEQVLRGGADAFDYAALLVRNSQHIAPVLFECAMAQDGKHVRARVQRILSFSNGVRSSARSRLAVFAGIALLFSAGVLVPAKAEKIYRMGGDVAVPKLLHKIEPDYTKKAKRDKIQGTVLLNLVVGADGVPKKVAVLKSLDAALDKEAVKAVSKWRFEPGKKHGKPVSVRAKVEVNFRLL